MQDKPQTARFGTTLFLDNPLHRQAWELLSAIPAGQRTNWLCLALCQQAQREQFLQDLKTILNRSCKAAPTHKQFRSRSQPGALTMTFSAFCARCRKKVTNAEPYYKHFEV